MEDKKSVESPASPGSPSKVETESDHYMEMYVDGQIKEKIDPLEELTAKLKEDLKILNEKYE